ncbi:heavy metal translocating P-type ATPase [Botrimarina mediterranea]|uniref:Copper-exporting P-type ATPase A n=1 Tax=Botrimarina mediterranea TaxID=2528022 RepID=A0A518K8M4_9BACT|nr:heavy metal translocating P-type ATPase [Botrimarina mediterranea]QDV74144.1 Copper-exporting P-type ATPase A [Botrimarina mediterranea]QDV78775.1 Copper-exporting P-type ATPase A [Planctomycetes bacterium K2D]
MNAVLDATDNETRSKSARRGCHHCGLPVPEALFIADATEQFCCSGCQVAYETIHGCGLADYYALRERFGSGHASTGRVNKRYAAYDSQSFLDKHTTEADSGLRRIEFRLEGVHCAACVWLVERLPHIAPGVVEARLSLGASRARITWDPQGVTLSTIATTLDRLGYAPHPARDGSARAAAGIAERRRLVNMAIAGALAGNNMLIATALYAGVFDGIEAQFATLFRWLSLAIGWLSLIWPGQTFFRGAWAAWRARTANLDQPIALALAIGAVAGTMNVLLDRGEVYFDSLSALVFLLLVGRFLQARQQRWAQESVGLMLSMTPDECHMVRDGVLIDESIDTLQSGDLVEVRAGELFPADGVVTQGESAIDQSLLTGESQPTPVAIGDAVCAGAQNVAATLCVRVDTVGAATRIGRLVSLVEEGLAAKPPIIQMADRIAGRFIVVVVTLAIANLAWWWSTVGLEPGIDATVALLIVACPCALGLATPLTMAVAIGSGAKRGMLIKSAAVLEKLASVGPNCPGRLFVDKTGTLTSGKMRVEAYHGDDRLRVWIAAIESESNHPIARAIVADLPSVGPEARQQVRQRQEKHGFGVTARTPVGQLLVSSPRFAAENAVAIAEHHHEIVQLGLERGMTVVLAAVDGRCEAVLWLKDQLHADSRERLQWLRDAGWRTAILSGDASGPVRLAAEAVGVDGNDAHSEMAPEEKLARVREATLAGNGVVMMVGDGVNDATSLAAADIGVAVHGGAEASLVAADVYLTEAGVGRLVELVDLSRRTLGVMRRNLAISLTYNTVAVSLAAIGWITPLAAALLMPLSSLSVLASAASLANRRSTKRE